jgi:hypothetical protein
MAALKNRMDNSRQQELSVLESQAPNRSLNAGTMNHGDITEAPTLSQGSPKHEIQQSPDLTYAGLADDSTLHNNDEELDLGRAHESGILASTSPSASARIVRVSHTPGRFFDSPGNESSYQTAAQRPPARKNFPAGPRFIDAQENRAQVSPISSVYGHSAEKEYAAPSNANQKKRARRPSYSSDISDDGAFEDDDRDVDRRAEKPQQTFPAAKRQRTEAGAGSDSPAQQLQLSLNATRQSQAEATLASEGPDHSTAEQSAGTSRWEAQLKRNASSYTRKANNRWTEEEDERLLMLMAIHGPQWSLIEKEDAICPASEGGPKLEARSQVNLKDRARNLRKKYNR